MSNQNKINIKLIFMGIIGEKIGKRDLILQFEKGITFKSFLNFIFKEFSSEIPSDFIDSNQNQFKMIHFIRNNKDIDLESQSNQILSNNDKIYFVPPMGGG